MDKMILHIEKPIHVGTPMAQCLDVISFAVGTYNSRLISVLGLPHPDTLSWDEWLREMINRNDKTEDSPFKMFKWGFSGSHFWLHNLKEERTIFITTT